MCMCVSYSCTDVNPAAAQCTAKTASCNKVLLQPVITSLVSFIFLVKTILHSVEQIIFDISFVNSVKTVDVERGSVIFSFDDCIV